MDISFYQTEKKISCKGDSPLNSITHIFLDVDGTLTDGGIYYDSHGNELKKFSVRDGAGFFTAWACGLEIVVITGRESQCVTRRMNELGVKTFVQGVHDKPAYIREYMQSHSLTKEQTAYIGDDFIDFQAMQMTGFSACPADSADEIKAYCDYVSGKNGGNGAFREIISYMLKQRGQWKTAVSVCYHLNSEETIS